MSSHHDSDEEHVFAFGHITLRVGHPWEHRHFVWSFSLGATLKDVAERLARRLVGVDARYVNFYRRVDHRYNGSGCHTVFRDFIPDEDLGKTLGELGFRDGSRVYPECY